MRTSAFAWGLVAVIPVSLNGARAAAPLPDFRPSYASRENNAGDSDLLLDLWVNDHARNRVVRARDDGETLWMRREDLAAAGVNVPVADANADGLVSLAAIGGIAWRIDGTAQRVELTVRADFMAAQVLDLRPGVDDAGDGEAATGMILEYDAVANVADIARAEATARFGANLALTIFTPDFNATTTAFGETGGGEDRLVRLDSVLTVDDPGSLRTWTVGDSITGGLGWSRSVRFGGISLARNFDLRPGLVTIPLPDFFGKTEVPASVEVLAGASQIFEGTLEPGPFELRNLPIVTGAGEATIIVRDVLGRETAQTIPLYVTNQMLDDGLLAYSVDAGFLRGGYGVTSFDYGAPVAAATVRYGVTDYATVEAHAEASDGVAVAGGGVTFSVAPIAAVSLAAAASTGDAGDGALFSATIESRRRPLTLFASYSQTVGDYSDLASLDGDPPPLSRLQVGATLSLGEYGSLGASWIDIERRDLEPSKVASVSWSASMGGGFFFGVTGLYDDIAGEWAAESFLSFPLGEELQGSASARMSEFGEEYRATIEKQANPDGGLGYSVSVSADEFTIVEAVATWYADHARVDAGVTAIDDIVSARAGISGALIGMDDSLFATPRVDGAFALVRAGREDVRIYRENREVATADADGEALLTGLSPYDVNHIAVEPKDYPMNAVLGSTERAIVPRRRSGAIADFRPQSTASANLTVHMPDGSEPPAGSAVKFDGVTELWAVGRRGRIFVPDLRATHSGEIRLDHGACRFTFEVPEIAGDAIPEIGPLTCTLEDRP